LIPTRWPKPIGNLPFKTVQLGPWNWISGHSAKNSSSSRESETLARKQRSDGVSECWSNAIVGFASRVRPLLHYSTDPITSLPRVRSYKRNPNKQVEDFEPVNPTGLSVVASHAKLVPARHFFYVKFHSALHLRSSSIRVRLLISLGGANRRRCQTTLRR
jgi:hypothetical protein